MKTKIGINGFGRIGRQVLKAIKKYHVDKFDVVAINDLYAAKIVRRFFIYKAQYSWKINIGLLLYPLFLHLCLSRFNTFSLVSCQSNITTPWAQLPHLSLQYSLLNFCIGLSGQDKYWWLRLPEDFFDVFLILLTASWKVQELLCCFFLFFLEILRVKCRYCQPKPHQNICFLKTDKSKWLLLIYP